LNYVTLHSRINKIILQLWLVFILVAGLYAAFVYKEFPTLIKAYTSVEFGFFFIYHCAQITVLIITVALAYGYGYKKGLRLGKNVTQG
jgi:hypothetical protein